MIPDYIKNFFARKRKASHPGKRLNILIVAPYSVYPVYTGGKGRIYQKIKYFGQHHDLVVVCYFDSSRNKPLIKKYLASYCRKIKLVKRQEPFLADRRDIPGKVYEKTTLNMQRTLNSLGKRFDIVMFEHIYLAEYRSMFENTFTVLEEHNIESSILRQLVETGPADINEAKLEAQKMQDYETANWPGFNLVSVVSERDRDEIRQRCACELIVVENGVDTESIRPVAYNNSDRILYMGHLAYRPNIEAVKYLVEHIMPVILKVLPDTTLCIAGTNPSEEILALQDLEYIDIVADPPDMGEVASRCLVVVVPLIIGGGTRIKILEAMAMGIPVVSTSLGCQGLAVQNREHLVICDEPDKFANAILEIKSDKQFRNKLRRNGRYLVKTRYDWKKIYRKYENTLLSRFEHSIEER